jgi:quercetin dioxygenase-like cupin family protein
MDVINERAIFGGKVLKRSLPVFHGPPPAGTLGPKRLILPQGELANFYDADDGLRYAALIEMRIGSIRGNHVHRVKEELIYVISGRLELVVQEMPEGGRATLELVPGDLAFIATGIAHAIKPLESGLAMEFSKARFDPADVEKVALI